MERHGLASKPPFSLKLPFAFSPLCLVLGSIQPPKTLYMQFQFLHRLSCCRFSSERLTRAEALKGMTLDAAYAAHQEYLIGSLTPGKRADYVLLDTDILEVEPVEDVLKTRVMATVVDGRVEYGSVE